MGTKLQQIIAADAELGVMMVATILVFAPCSPKSTAQTAGKSLGPGRKLMSADYILHSFHHVMAMNAAAKAA